MARRKKQEECEECEDWLATYGDMVTLLMCFFVLLASASKVDVALFEQIQAGMNEGIGKKDVQRPVELMVMELSEDVQSMDMGETIALGTDSQGIVLEFPSETLFEPSSAELLPQSLSVIKRIAATLKVERYKMFKFAVEGHTDDIPIETEEFPSNWELSSARASAVLRVLLSRGIEATRLRAVGFADISPKVPNRDAYGEPIPENQRKNRRVTIHIEPLR